MIKKVHVVINVIGGIVNGTDVFAEEKDALHRYREIIEANTPFTRKEIMDSHGADKNDFDNVWQKDSEEFLYDADKDLYYPISTHDHDVHISEEFIDYEGYQE